MVIAIGALGGSGTRVVAEILENLDIFIGNDLNGAKDNLLYTRLFKNINWYKSSSIEDRFIRHQIFEKCMTGVNLSFSERIEFFKAAKSNTLWKSSLSYYKNIFFGSSLIASKSHNKWGWKEPNTHIFIEDIHRYFKGLKYIYVIRHGLDMAYSSNKQQLHNWGFLYGINVNSNDTAESLAKKQLQFWIKSSERAISLGQELFNENFYILNHQKLCEKPRAEIEKLVSFLSLNINEEQIKNIAKLPKMPRTSGRYKSKDISVFSEEELNKTKSLGFTI